MDVVYVDSEYFRLRVPYIPGFLAFREIDPILNLVEKQLRDRPDLTPRAILVDGNGLLHPRGAGIACFLCFRTGIPTIGIGKTLFCEGALTKEIVWRGIVDSLTDAVESQLAKNDPGFSVDNRCLLMSHCPISAFADHVGSESPISISGSPQRDDRNMMVEKLSSYCQGFAIPLKTETNATPAPRQSASVVSACALIGHGGRPRRTAKAEAKV
jgi:hypothetical protein